jgi:hypothetical protein
VAQVVGAELQLEAVRRPAVRDVHDPGVGDQDVEASGPALGEGPHRGQVGQVQPPHLDVPGEPGGGALTAGRVAHGQHDAGTGGGECPGGLQAQAAVGPGDHRGAAGLRRDVGGGPRGAHDRGL